MPDSIRQQSTPELRQRGAIIVLVIGLHAVAVAGLLIVQLVEHVGPRKEPRMVITYVPLQPVPMRGRRNRRSRGGATAPVTYFNPFASYGKDRFVLHISPYKGSLAPPCHYVLAPSSDAFKQHCMGQTQPADEAEDSSPFLDIPATSERWKSDMKNRDMPYQVPCTYVHNFPQSGGPPPPPARMADIGCAVGQLFGH